MNTPYRAEPLLLLTALFLGISYLRIPTATPVYGAVHEPSMNAVVNGSILPAPAANQRPPKPELTDQTTYAGGTFTYTVPEVADPDGDSLTYEAFLGAWNKLPRWIKFDSGTRTFTFKPRNAHIGEMKIRVSVSDGSVVSYDDFTLEVTAAPPNRPPTAPSLAGQTATEDTSFSYTVPAFTDPDGDTLTYTADQSNDDSLPSWLGFNTGTRALSGTPEEANTPATLTIRVTASDGTLSSSATFTLTVEEVNDAPTAPSIPAQTANEGQPFSYQTPSFVDPEGDSVTYTATLDDGGELPAWLAFDPESHTFSGTPGDADTPATLTVRITASDGTLSSAATLALTVEEVNDPPVAGNDSATVTEGDAVTINTSTLLANDSDPEGATLSISSVGSAVNGTALLSEDKATVTYTHDGSETTSDSFDYTVSDGSASSTATVTIAVTAANDSPIANNDSASVAEGGALAINTSTLLANDSDPEGATLTISSVGSAVNGTALLSEDKATVTYTHDGSETTSGSFDYTVSDGSATSTATVTITVTPINDPPSKPSLTDQTATTGQPFIYQVPEATDPDDELLTYNAALA